MLACCVLELGVLTGVPMRPEQVKELMQLMNRLTRLIASAVRFGPRDRFMAKCVFIASVINSAHHV